MGGGAHARRSRRRSPPLRQRRLAGESERFRILCVYSKRAWPATGRVPIHGTRDAKAFARTRSAVLARSFSLRRAGTYMIALPGLRDVGGRCERTQTRPRSTEAVVTARTPSLRGRSRSRASSFRRFARGRSARSPAADGRCAGDRGGTARAASPPLCARR